MTFDVFISYPNLDKPTADAACATLEAAGVRCWIAPRDIVPGADYGAAIVDAIRNAKVFVLIFSDNANVSPHIAREVERAVHRGIPIIPVRIQEVQPRGTLEYFLATPHWLDALTPPLEAHLQQLTASVKALLNVEPQPSGKPPVGDEPPSLSDIRRQFIAAKTIWDLERAQYAIDAFIDRAPGNVDALQLRGQIRTAITRQRQTAEARAPTSAQPPAAFSRQRFPLAVMAAGLAALILAVVAFVFWQRTGQPQPLWTLSGHSKEADSVAFSPDGSQIAAGGWDGSVRIWKVADGAFVRALTGIDGRSAPYSLDGKWIATGGAKDFKVWDAGTGRLALTVPGVADKVLTVAFTPDSNAIVSGGRDKIVRVWNREDGKPLLALSGHTAAVWSVEVSHDGKEIVSSGDDGTIRVWSAMAGRTLWNTVTGRVLQTITGNAGSVHAATFSPDGANIAAGMQDGTVRVWEADSGQSVKQLPGHLGAVLSVAYSPDGKQIASASYDATVNIWNANTGQIVATLRGHKGPVYAVTYSPDGKLIATAGDDTTVKIWNAP